MSIDQIKNDVDLRPLFFEIIGRKHIVGLMEIHQVNAIDKIRMTSELNASINTATEILKARVKEEDIYPIMSEVCSEYSNNFNTAIELMDPRLFKEG